MHGRSPLVGRGRELLAFDAALAEVAAGTPGALLLAGEAGIGKSRLLAELAARAEEAGHLVLAGRGTELERDLPLAPVAGALGDYLTALPARALEPLGPEDLSTLAAGVPGLAVAPGPPPTSARERVLLYRATRRLLALLAAEQPLVLVLDDLHWSDPGTHELVAHLLRQPPPARVLLALGLRPRQSSPALLAAAEEAVANGRLRRMQPAPLGPDEAAQLLGGRVRGARRERLVRESAGNPFYLLALAAGDGGGAAAAAGDAPPLAVEGVPPAVLAALGGEVAALADRDRLALEGAAVVGDPFDAGLAARAADLPEPVLLEALDALRARDLVRSTDVPRRFAFRHPLVRRAAYEAAGAGWRIGAHDRVARALEQAGAGASARAWHVERSAAEGDLDASGLLATAAREAGTLAPTSAALWLGAALRLLPARPDLAERRLGLRIAHAGALANAGDLGGSQAMLVEVLDELGPGPLRVGMVCMCSALQHLLGDHEAATGRLLVELEAQQGADTPETVGLLLELAADAQWRSDWGELGRRADQALAAARSLQRPAPALLANACALVGFGEYCAGRPDEAAVRLAEAGTLWEALSDDELAARLDTAVWLGVGDMLMSRFAQAAARFERGLAVARTSGQGSLVQLLSTLLVQVTWERGRLAEAAALAETALDASRLTGPQDRFLALALSALVAVGAGDVGFATAAAADALVAGEGLHGVMRAVGAEMVARVLLDLGRPADAAEVLLDPEAGPPLEVLAPGHGCAVRELLVRAELGRGRPEQAERHAADAEALIACASPLARAQTLRARALVELEGGRLEAALAAAREAVAIADACDVPVEAARARIVASQAMAGAGDRDGAVAALERAERELTACGALRLRDEVVRELRRLGRRTVAPAREGVSGVLSPREREVAELVGAGHTNRAIAGMLVLSERTVETHVKHILGKLGLASRAAVGAALSRETAGD